MDHQEESQTALKDVHVRCNGEGVRSMCVLVH
jgi:hypothetical protein